MAEHRVCLMERIDGFFYLVEIDMHIARERKNILVVLGQEFVERRVEQADCDGESVHCFENRLKVPSLHREQLVEGGFALFNRFCKNHLLIAGILSASKNMCSVRQRPIPSAPKFLAVLASPGYLRLYGF